MASLLSSIRTSCYQCTDAARILAFSSQRQFHSSGIALARVRKVAAPSKKKLAAKASRKAAKSRKSIYDNEKLKLSDAIAVLRAVEVAQPNATYELLIRTEMSKGTTVPKGRYSLPRETTVKKQDRILVFAEGKAADEARNAGADIVGGLELVDGVISGRHQANIFLCTPALIRAITPKLGRVLGPRGLMPSERRGTVLEDFAGYFRRLKGTSEWTGDKSGTIRMPIAKMNFPVDDVTKNVRYFLTLVKRATGNARDPNAEVKKDGGSRPVNAITKVMLSSPQGPGIRIADP